MHITYAYTGINLINYLLFCIDFTYTFIVKLSFVDFESCYKSETDAGGKEKLIYIYLLLLVKYNTKLILLLNALL